VTSGLDAALSVTPLAQLAHLPAPKMSNKILKPREDRKINECPKVFRVLYKFVFVHLGEELGFYEFLDEEKNFLIWLRVFTMFMPCVLCLFSLSSSNQVELWREK
jgi:hypothetical protein